MLKINISNLLLILFFITTTQASASERDQWQQFKAFKGMDELDAQFDKPKPKPEVRVETKVVEKIVEKVVIKEVPVEVIKEVIKEVPVEVAAEPAPAPVAEPVADNTITVESDGFVFKLSSCKSTHRNIKCDLRILNPEQDGSLTLYAGYNKHYSSKLFDTVGNEYWSSKVTMGNKTHKNSIKNRYITGITAKGSLHFENLDKSTNAIALLELSYYNSSSDKLERIQFRNVGLEM